jgi:hypothetical protein
MTNANFSLEECQCPSAALALENELFTCDTACPENCSACETCLEVIGCSSTNETNVTVSGGDGGEDDASAAPTETPVSFDLSQCSGYVVPW